MREAVERGDMTQISEYAWREQCVKQESLIGSNGNEALVAFSSEDLFEAARRNFVIGVISDSEYRALVMSTDKLAFWNALKCKGHALPFFTACSSDPGELAELIHTIPCENIVFKPVRSSDSKGVCVGKKSCPEEFLSAIAMALKECEQHSEFLFTEFVGHPARPSEYAVNVIVADGEVFARVIHQKYMNSGPPLFRDFAIVSASISEEDSSLLNASLDNVVSALNVTNGILQLEYMVSVAGNWIPIDAALRPDGGLMADAIAVSTGYDVRLLHSYAMSGQHQHFESVLSAGPNQTPAQFTAVGAFYSTRPESGGIGNLIQAVLSGEFPNPHISAAYYESEAATIPLCPPEHGAAFCVFGDSSEGALANLEQAGANYGFDIGSEWARDISAESRRARPVPPIAGRPRLA